MLASKWALRSGCKHKALPIHWIYRIRISIEIFILFELYRKSADGLNRLPVPAANTVTF